MNASVEGVEELGKVFEKMIARAESAAMEKVMEAGMVPTFDAIYRKTPVRSEELRKSLTVVIRRKGSEVTGHVGTNMAMRALWVEKGTKASGERPWSTPAHPFLRPGLRSSYDAAVREIRAALKVHVIKP